MRERVSFVFALISMHNGGSQLFEVCILKLVVGV
jgi:hypothetical protein